MRHSWLAKFHPAYGELTTWAVIFTFLGWSSLIAALISGFAERRFFLVAGLVLFPLGIGLGLRHRWARVSGMIVLSLVLTWSVWKLWNHQVQLLAAALIAVCLETLWCLVVWPQKRPAPPADKSAADSESAAPLSR